jgi:hypothetical protein
MSRRVYGLQRQPSGKCRFAGHGHTGFGGVILPGNGLWRCSFALLLQSQWRINFTSGSHSLLPLGQLGTFQRIQQQAHLRLISR